MERSSVVFARPRVAPVAWCAAWLVLAGSIRAQAIDDPPPSALAAPEMAAPDPAALDDVPNPFAGVESWKYPNGLVVHFKDMPSAETIFFRMTLPVGAREDPEGLGGIAHFVEHLMFTADGMTMAEFQRQVEERGGSTNASTNRDRTDYWLKLPAQEWRFGLDWFSDLLFGHQFVDQHVQDERRAVILEKDLKPKTPLDHLVKWVLNPDWSRAPGFWERELGIRTEHRPTIGTWEEIQAATRDDLQAFHDRWYGPQNMTVAIFGRLDRDAVKAAVDARFGAVPRFGEDAKVRVSATPRKAGLRTEVKFEERGGHSHAIVHVVQDATRQDREWMIFLAGLLREHLNDVLREERQAAYGIEVTRNYYRGHATLEVKGNFEAPQEAEARAYVDAFLADLRAGAVSPELFEALRRRVVAPLLLNNQEPSALAEWIVSALHQREIFGDEFIDPISFARGAAAGDLATWMRERLPEDRRTVSIERPSPLGPTTTVVLTLLAVLGTFAAARRALVRPLDLTRLVYLRKVQYGVVGGLAITVVLTLAIIAGLNAVLGLARPVKRALIDPVDVFAVQFLWGMFMTSLLTLLVMLAPASVPRKVLLLDDHWRIKALSYRSRSFRYEDTHALRRRHLFAVLLDWRSWPCRVLHWGIFSRGVHLRCGRGSWFLHTRADEELIEQLVRRGASRSEPVAAPAPDADGAAERAGGGPVVTGAPPRAS